jgi:hypothetical protein
VKGRLSLGSIGQDGLGFGKALCRSDAPVSPFDCLGRPWVRLRELNICPGPADRVRRHVKAPSCVPLTIRPS